MLGKGSDPLSWEVFVHRRPGGFSASVVWWSNIRSGVDKLLEGPMPVPEASA